MSLSGDLDDARGLGVNEHHEKEIVKYMRFMRYQRSLRIKTVEASFDDYRKAKMKKSSFDELTTFDLDEMSDMIDELKTQIRRLIVSEGEIETELLNAAHTNVLLLRQLCGQAENWHLKLMVNVSELENKDLLTALETFENDQFDFSAQKPSQSKLSITVLKQLSPLVKTGSSGEPADLLKEEIERLKHENLRLASNLKQVESKAVELAEQKFSLTAMLEKERENLQTQLESTDKIEEGIEHLDSIRGNDEALIKLNTDLEQSKSVQKDLESTLVETNKKLLLVREHLEMAEKELEKKFSQTATYKNMKQMLTKKNDQIKAMRRVLAENNIDLSKEAGGSDD